MTTETITKTKYEGMSEKVKHIYRLYNGLVLEATLKDIAKNDTFKFIKDENNYTFISEDGELVIVDECGDILDANIPVSQTFIEICQNRLSRTNEMLDAVWG